MTALAFYAPSGKLRAAEMGACFLAGWIAAGGTGMMKYFKRTLYALCLFPALSYAEIPPEFPSLDRQVQINASNLMWPNRVFIRWKLSDGRWWCAYDTKENVRAAMIQKIDDMLAPYGSGETSWRNVDFILAVGGGNLGVFEKTWCFSWLPP